MKIIDYLESAFKVDEMIEDRKQQIANLESIATNLSSVITDMPGSGNRNIHKMEDTIIKLTEQKHLLEMEIAGFVELKINVSNLVNKVKNREQHAVLVERYLHYKAWEEIAVMMNYNIRHIYRLRDAAIKQLEEDKE